MESTKRLVPNIVYILPYSLFPYFIIVKLPVTGLMVIMNQ